MHKMAQVDPAYKMWLDSSVAMDSKEYLDQFVIEPDAPDAAAARAYEFEVGDGSKLRGSS